MWKLLLGQWSGGSGKHHLLPKVPVSFVGYSAGLLTSPTRHGHKNWDFFNMEKFWSPQKGWSELRIVYNNSTGAIKPPTQNTTAPPEGGLCQMGNFCNRLHWAILIDIGGMLNFTRFTVTRNFILETNIKVAFFSFLGFHWEILTILDLYLRNLILETLSGNSLFGQIIQLRIGPKLAV